MPGGVRKQKRNKHKHSTTHSSTASSSKTKAYHTFLDEREKSAIDNWNQEVPKKSARATNVPEQQDPAIQAYLQAKMALFRNAAMKDKQDNRSVSSTQS